MFDMPDIGRLAFSLFVALALSAPELAAVAMQHIVRGEMTWFRRKSQVPVRGRGIQSGWPSRIRGLLVHFAMGRLRKSLYSPPVQHRVLSYPRHLRLPRHRTTIAPYGGFRRFFLGGPVPRCRYQCIHGTPIVDPYGPVKHPGTVPTSARPCSAEAQGSVLPRDETIAYDNPSACARETMDDEEFSHRIAMSECRHVDAPVHMCHVGLRHSHNDFLQVCRYGRCERFI